MMTEVVGGDSSLIICEAARLRNKVLSTPLPRQKERLKANSGCCQGVGVGQALLRASAKGVCSSSCFSSEREARGLWASNLGSTAGTSTSGVEVGVKVWSPISQLEERVTARGIGGGHHIRVLAIVTVEDMAFWRAPGTDWSQRIAVSFWRCGWKAPLDTEWPRWSRGEGGPRRRDAAWGGWVGEGAVEKALNPSEARF